jgi:hypothetical protein
VLESTHQQRLSEQERRREEVEEKESSVDEEEEEEEGASEDDNDGFQVSEKKSYIHKTFFSRRTGSGAKLKMAVAAYSVQF